MQTASNKKNICGKLILHAANIFVRFFLSPSGAFGSQKHFGVSFSFN
jgi:hypothetical protein